MLRKTRDFFAKVFLNEKAVVFIMLLLVLIPTVQRLLETQFSNSEYTSFNNFIIFRNAFFHLMENKNLYAWYLDIQWDLFKYSPTFALFMAPFAIVPTWLGLFLWNLINTFLVYLGVRQVAFKHKRYVYLALIICFAEAITNTHNAQSNGVMAGLLVLSFVSLEKRNVVLATFLIVLTFYVKVYGLAFLALLVFYPDKIKSILWTGIWLLFLGVLPALFIGMDGLVFQYQQWWLMMVADQGASMGFSIMGWLHTWFGLSDIKNSTMLLGAVLFFVPLVRYQLYDDKNFRTLFAAFILIWLIIFNHKSESPTFIIAIAGVVLWFFTVYAKRKHWFNLLLLWGCILFCVLAPTDVYPPYIRQTYFEPYVVKVVPCIFIWLKLFYDLMAMKRENTLTK